MKKIYAHDESKYKANLSTARERLVWNIRVDEAKEMRKAERESEFVPRKVSHKQGYKLAFAA